MVSMPISIASLSWSSTKAYFLQRLFPYGDPDPPLNLALRVMPIYLLFIIPSFVLTWALLAAYFRVMVLGTLVLTFLANGLLVYLDVKYAWQQDPRDKFGYLEREKEDIWEMSMLSAMTSVISPCMPISNKLNTLFFGAISTVSCLMVWLLLISLSFEYNFNIIGLKYFTPPPPITHCLRTNLTDSSGVCTHSRINTTNCQQLVRYCDNFESPFEMMNWILPSLALYLFVSLLCSWFLQWFSDHSNAFWLTNKFPPGKGVIHRNLIHDLILDKDVGTLQNIAETFSEDLREVLNRPYQNGDTALHILSRRKNVQHLEQLKILLESCAGPKTTNSTSGNSCNLLLEKCKKAVNTPNRLGQTPLHTAISYHNHEAAALLIHKGANVNVQDKDGNSPLHMAAKFNRVKTPKLLIQKEADVNAQDNNRNSPLHLAAKFNSMQTAKLLIQKEANMNVEDKDGNSPLHLAATFNSVKTARLLIQEGAIVDAQDMHGYSPLHTATIHNRVEVAKLLLESDVNVFLMNKDGETPLDKAAANLFGNRNMKELFDRKREEALMSFQNTDETPIL